MAHGNITSRSTDCDGQNKWIFLYDDGHQETVRDAEVVEFAIDYVDGQIIDDPFEGDLSHDGDDADIIVAEDHTAPGALACAKVKLYHGGAPCKRYHQSQKQ